MGVGRSIPVASRQLADGFTQLSSTEEDDLLSQLVAGSIAAHKKRGGKGKGGPAASINKLARKR
jgi:hypothetical protein